MTPIKVILVAAFLGVMVWAFRNRAQVGMRASALVVLLLMTVIAIASVIDPNIPQSAANFVGVTRGRDLVIYIY